MRTCMRGIAVTLKLVFEAYHFEVGQFDGFLMKRNAKLQTADWNGTGNAEYALGCLLCQHVVTVNTVKVVRV